MNRWWGSWLVWRLGEGADRPSLGHSGRLSGRWCVGMATHPSGSLVRCLGRFCGPPVTHSKGDSLLPPNPQRGPMGDAQMRMF